MALGLGGYPSQHHHGTAFVPRQKATAARQSTEKYASAVTRHVNRFVVPTRASVVGCWPMVMWSPEETALLKGVRSDDTANSEVNHW